MTYKQFTEKLSAYFSPSEICMIDKYYTDVAVDTGLCRWINQKSGFVNP